MKKIRIPGSKSVSNRALVLAALGDQPVLLKNLLRSDDIDYLQNCLSNFGVKFEDIPAGLLVTPPERLTVGETAGQYIGAGGTPARFVCALSLIVEGRFKVSGIPRMHERPFADLFAALSDLGIEIEAENAGFLPAWFTKPSMLSGEVVRISGQVSSQFVSGLMLAATATERGLTLQIDGQIPSQPYVSMTAEIIRQFGGRAEIAPDWSAIRVEAGLSSPAEFMIPGDASSLSYPVAWSVLHQTPVCVENVGYETWHGDEKFLQVVAAMGAEVQREGVTCVVRPQGPLKALGDTDWSTMPDVSMTGMVLAAFAHGETVFHGLESLRVKECDRIEAMRQGLMSLGIEVSVEGDVMTIVGKLEGRSMKEEVKLDAHDDHRIAFCLALLLSVVTDFTVAEMRGTIEDEHSVTKSWPAFWECFADWQEELRPVSAIMLSRESQNSKSKIQSKEYLIVKKPRKDHAWQFPQGGVDPGEIGLQAAKRELSEECGEHLVVKFKGEKPVGEYKYLFPKGFSRHDKSIVGAKVEFFAAEYLSGAVEVDGTEIIDHAWVTADEFDQYFTLSYQDIVNSLL